MSDADQKHFDELNRLKGAAKKAAQTLKDYEENYAGRGKQLAKRVGKNYGSAANGDSARVTGCFNDRSVVTMIHQNPHKLTVDVDHQIHEQAYLRMPREQDGWNGITDAGWNSSLDEAIEFLKGLQVDEPKEA